MTSSTYHLLDERLIASKHGVALQLGTVCKSRLNPLFGEDRPWESSLDNAYLNVLFDPIEKLYKLWYTPFLDRTRHDAQTLCYACSSDGLQWEKPELGLFEYGGSARNNIVLPFITGAGIALDAQAAAADERYKMTYLVHPQLAPEWAGELAGAGHPLAQRGGGVGFSADGIHWRLRPDNPVLPGIAGDTHNNWVWDKRSRKYVWITRANVPFEDARTCQQKRFKNGEWKTQASDVERVVKRWESDDFIHWGNGAIVFRAQDEEVGQRQYYSMPTFPYGNGYLGLLSLFNPEPDTVDLELAWSPDTIRWQRICRGQAFIPRGDAASLDAGCIYAGWSPVTIDDEIRIYYAGSRETHGAGIQRRTSALLATLPRDRYAGWHAVSEGEILTAPIACAGPQVLLNTDASRGSIQTELRRPDGSPIEGLTFAESGPITVDSLDVPVRWKERESLQSLMGSQICIALRLNDAVVYTLQFTS